MREISLFNNKAYHMPALWHDQRQFAAKSSQSDYRPPPGQAMP
jgi:hypothetical protein